MGEPYIAGLFGMLGVLVGGLIQTWFGRRSSQETRYLELKSTAYADYVNAIASIAFANAGSRDSALAKITAAKARICVFGDSEILERLVALEETSLNLADNEAQKAFIDLIQAMRSRGIAVGKSDDQDFRIVLFGAKS